MKGVVMVMKGTLVMLAFLAVLTTLFQVEKKPESFPVFERAPQGMSYE